MARKQNELKRNLIKSQLKNNLEGKKQSAPYIGSSLDTTGSSEPPQSSHAASSHDRRMFAVAFKTIAILHKTGLITQWERAVLKQLTLKRDVRIFAAVEVYELGFDRDDLLDSFRRIAALSK